MRSKVGFDRIKRRVVSYHQPLRMMHVHDKDNGELVTDPVIYGSNLGVGQYSAATGKIEAERFSSRQAVSDKKERPGGMSMTERYFPSLMGIRSWASSTGSESKHPRPDQ